MKSLVIKCLPLYALKVELHWENKAGGLNDDVYLAEVMVYCTSVMCNIVYCPFSLGTCE